MKRYKITFDKVQSIDGGLNIEEAINGILVNNEGFIKLEDGTFLRKGVQFNLAFSSQAISVNHTKENPLSDPTLYPTNSPTSTGIIDVQNLTATTCNLVWDSTTYPLTFTDASDMYGQIRATVEGNLGNWSKVVCYKSADAQDVSYMLGNAGASENFQIRFSDPTVSFASYDTTESGDAGARGKITWIAKDDNKVCSLFIHDDSDSIGVWIAVPFLIPKTHDSTEIWEGFYKCGFVQKEQGGIVVAHSSPLAISDSLFQYTSASYSRDAVSNCCFFSAPSDYWDTGREAYTDNILQYYSKEEGVWYLNNPFRYSAPSLGTFPTVEGKIALPYSMFDVSYICWKTCNLGLFSALQTSSGVGYMMMPTVLTQYMESGLGSGYKPKQKIVCNDIPFIYMTSPKDAEDGNDLNIGSRKFRVFTGAVEDGYGRAGFYDGSIPFRDSQAGSTFYQGFAFEITSDNEYTP